MKRIVIGDKMREIDIETKMEDIKRDAYEHASMIDSNRIEPIKFMELDAHINDYVRSKYEDVVPEEDMDDLINEVVEEWARDTNVLLKERDSDRGFIIDMLNLDEGEYEPVGMSLMTGAELSKMKMSRCYE